MIRVAVLRRLTFVIVATALAACGIDAVGTLADLMLLGYGTDYAIKIDPITGAGSTWNASTGIVSYGAASGP